LEGRLSEEGRVTIANLNSASDIDNSLLNFLIKELEPLKLTNQEKLSPHGREVID
jgi:hypothetical protein